MKHRSGRMMPSGILTLLLALGVTTASFGGGLSVFSIALTGHGDSLKGSAGAPVALTPTSFLVGVEGPDGNFQSADDEVLLVTNLDSAPVLTALPVPFMADFSARITRFSATRAGTLSAGPDDTFGNSDDQFYLLDRLGTDNTITPIGMPGVGDLDAATAVVLTTDSAVFRTEGLDNIRTTADDTLALLTDLGNSNTVTQLSAPFTLDFSDAWPVALSPTSVVLCPTGPDATPRTADDALHLFTGLGTTNTLTTIPLPHTARQAGGRPTRISSTSVLVVNNGPDATDGTADDGLRLITGLGSTNTVTPIPLPHIQRNGANRPALLSDTVAAVATQGPDSNGETADDTLAIITGLGTTNTVTHLTLGGIEEDAASAPQRLSPTSLVLATGGPNFTMENADDELVVVTGVGTTNTVTRIPLSGLSEGSTNQPAPVGVSSFLIASGGPDGNMESGGDDLLSLVTGVPGAPVVQSVAASINLEEFGVSCAPYPLGEGRAVAFSSGPNGVVGTGGDDLLRVMTNLPQPRGLLVKSVNLKFDTVDLTAKQNLAAKGTLALDDPTLLEDTDLTVSLGDFAQRIPAALVLKKSNGIFQYSDPNGARGPLKKLILNTKKRTFSIEGKGIKTGIETTDAGYIPVAIDAGEIYLSDLVAGIANSKGIKFKL